MAEARIEGKNNKRIIVGIVVIILLIISGLLLTNCSGPKQALTPQMEHQTGESVTHGTLTFDSNIGEPQQVEFWFDTNRYRLTWLNNDGTPRMHMISADGQNLWMANVEKQTTSVGYISPMMHLALIHQPTEYKNKTESTEGNYQVIVYDIDTLWNFPGSSQTFYLKDLTYYLKNNQIEKVVTRTSSKKKAEDELAVSNYIFAQMETLSNTDPALFENPYPMATPEQE